MKKTKQGFFNPLTNKFQPAPIKKESTKEAKDYLNNIQRMK